MSKLNIDQQTIKELFENKKSDFLIPDYQRPYAWGEIECQTLWDDIFSFAFPENDYSKFDSENDEYFVKKARKAATCKKDCCFSLQHKSAKETPRNRCHQISNLHISCRWVSCHIHLCFQLPPRREACNSVWEHPESRKLIVG